MPVTVRVRNFQSIEDATVVIDRFTVISGPNNSGKSALMRAIKGVFTNAAPGPLVRHGADHLTVDIDFGDGNTIRWEKGAKINRYTVNGKVLSTVGRGVPPEVEALGIRPIVAGAEKLWPQVADQFKGTLFLVGSPGSLIAEAVADVDRVGKLSTALKLAESDRRTLLSTLKVRRSDEKTLEGELAAFAGLDGVTSTTKDLGVRLAEAKVEREQVQTLSDLATRLQESQGQVTTLAAITDVVVPSAGQAAKVQQVGLEVASLEALRTRLAGCQSVVAALEGVQGVVLPADGAEATQAQQDLASLTLIRTRWETAQAVIKRLEGATQVQVPSGSSIQKPKKAQEAARVLLDIHRRYHKNLTDVQELEGELEGVEADLAAARLEVEALINELGVCPTCLRPTGDHTHEETP